MTEQNETKMPAEEMMNYTLDFAELDAMEAIEEEKAHMAKRGKQFLTMLGQAQSLEDLQRIKRGLGSAMRRRKEITKAKAEALPTPAPTEGKPLDIPAMVEAAQEQEKAFGNLKAKGSFQLWKEGDSLRWLAVYSNKFRDDDNPPEIISEKSHKNFVDMVDKGHAEYPELWYWHIPGTRFGKADYVAFDDSGFAIASGTIDKGKEDIAQKVASQEGQLMSHGMPHAFIERNDKDNSIIENHVSTEISVLPGEAAANKLTHFIMEEKNMSLPQEKAEALQGLGFDVDAIEQGLQAKAQAAIDSGTEFKEAEAPPVPVVEEAIPEPEQVQGDYVSRAELVELFGHFAEQVGETVKELKGQIAELSTTQTAEVEKQLQMTPAASLTAMWQSAIGSEEAKVDGRTTLAKAGPEETPSDAPDIPGLPQGIAQLVQQSRNGWNQ